MYSVHWLGFDLQTLQLCLFVSLHPDYSSSLPADHPHITPTHRTMHCVLMLYAHTTFKHYLYTYQPANINQQKIQCQWHYTSSKLKDCSYLIRVFWLLSVTKKLIAILQPLAASSDLLRMRHVDLMATGLNYCWKKTSFCHSNQHCLKVPYSKLHIAWIFILIINYHAKFVPN